MNAAYAYLAIIDPPTGLEEVTNRLRIAPTRLKKKGAPRAPGAAIVETSDTWILESPAGRGEFDLDRHVRDLLAVLEPKKKEVAAIVGESAGCLTLVSYSEHVNCQFTFSKQQLALIAELGVKVWCDIFFVEGEEMPNKAPEPTPGSVTPRAGARVAPVPVVAHL